jgi:hypothetical protein
MTTANLLGALTVGLLFVPTLGNAQSSERPTRELVKNQEPIQRRLLPEDRLVTIRRAGGVETGIEFSSPESELLILGQYEELVVVRQMVSEPYLADNDTWIRTRVHGRVSQVFNTGRLALFPGADVEFEFDGGEMLMKGVRLIAGWCPDLTSRPHLIALRKDSLTNRWVLAKAFELNDRDTLGPIKHRDKSEPAKSKLHGKTLDEIGVGIAKRQQ